MRTSAKLGLTALIAALLLSSAISTASARNLSISKEEIRATWNRLTFVEGSGGTLTECQFTMEGSFHRRTIPKVHGSLIGIITRATIKTESCTTVRMTIARLPWHITYEGFTGALPNINSIKLLLREFLITLVDLIRLGIECTYGTPEDRLLYTAAVNFERTVTNLAPEAGSRFTLLERRNDPMNLCPGTGRLANGTETEGQVTLLGSSTRTRVTLI